MKNGKYSNKKGLNMKPLALLLALALVFGGVVGGTIAWLTAQTGPVENTFTVGDINITLQEHELNDEGTLNQNSLLPNANKTGNTYNFVPGDTLLKDPFVTVKKETTADCYLFVKITEDNNTRNDLTDKIIQWEAQITKSGETAADTAWKKYVPTGETEVEYWYCEVAANTSADQVWTILKNNQVTVNDKITKQMVNEQNTGISTLMPDLKFEAAAVQKDNLTLADAWGQLPAEFRGNFAAPSANP